MKQLLNLFLFLTFILCASRLSAQSAAPPLEIQHLGGDLYVYTTYNTFKGKMYSANCIYLVTGKGVVVMDTPWDTTKYQPLLDTIAARHHQPVVLCIATHFHEDRTGWLNFLKDKGVKTYSSLQTYELCKENGLPQAAHYFTKDTVFRVGDYRIRTFYAGAGHTVDNIVVWFGKDRVLYGGCLIKSAEATDLGNIADADVNAWPATIRKLQQRFPKPAYVIPGHDDWRKTGSIENTLRLLQQHKQRGK